MKLTSHHHLLPKLRMQGAILSLPYALSWGGSCTGITLPSFLPVHHQQLRSLFHSFQNKLTFNTSRFIVTILTCFIILQVVLITIIKGI